MRSLMKMPRFDKGNVLVIGDVMLDRYWHGPTSRLSPEAPVPVVKVTQIEDRPGGAANVALNLAALGCGALISGATGNDAAADSLQARLTAAGVYCGLNRSDDFPTITKLRVISQHQQLIRLDFEESIPIAAANKTNSSAIELFGSAQAIVLSDYAKGTLAAPQELIAAAKAHGIPVLVDPKGSDFGRYKGATLLTPNLAEFEAVVGKCDSEAQIVERGLLLIAELELDALLVTRGENGMSLLRPNQPEFHLPAQAKEVFDVTGAGDTVISALAASLAVNESMENAVTLANLAASIVVGKLGTATISGPELRRAVNALHGSGRGVVSEEQLTVAIKDAKEQGETVVFTNGCFDIIHAGHVSYLEQARKLGDRLIVGINDDASVSKLKGSGRPINTVDRRKAVLAGLESVDWVFDFGDDTPERLLELLQPDILVKGGDYDKEGVVGWKIVEAYGGMVKVMSFVDDCSTTAIVEKIQSDNS
jgi:D-beta-D-heptose 7-phosphate kinase/D-beta-D-heptose 1-phosphate adenosyltransferase